MTSGVALLSGGLDSTVAAARFASEGDLLLALTVNYGQRAAVQEIKAAAAVAACFDLPHQVVDLPFLGALGGSVLLQEGAALPEPGQDDLDRAESARAQADAVWIPNRNGLLINVAACFAESLGADLVVVGFNAEEAASFPDNSQQFIDAADEALRLSTRGKVALSSPLAGLDKPAMVRLGLELGAPLERIWSCYGSGTEPCWRCASCLRLKRALEHEKVFEAFLAGDPLNPGAVKRRKKKER